MMWPKATVCILHGAGQGICHSKARKATINKGIKKKVNTTIDLILASVPVACAVAWHIAHCSTSGKCHYSASGNCHWLLQKATSTKATKINTAINLCSSIGIGTSGMCHGFAHCCGFQKVYCSASRKWGIACFQKVALWPFWKVKLLGMLWQQH